MVNAEGRVKELEHLLAQALATIEVLTKRVEVLEAQQKQNSGNSSKSPSSDMGRKKKPPVVRSGRQQGAQPGHAGKGRKRVPSEHVDVVKDVDPESCERCSEPLANAARRDATLRQFWETPAFKAFVHQINLWAKQCPKCGATTRAKVPAGTPKGDFGPNLQARTAILNGRFRMTKREIVVFHKTFHGVNVSLGSVQACCMAASLAIAKTAEGIHGELKQAAAVHADETGFGRCKGKRLWLWIIAGGDAEAFRLLAGRGKAQAFDLLGEDFKGHIHRDRWRAYEKLVKATHQLCHSHIRRDFQSMLESKSETGAQGCMLMLASDRMFHLWHQFERGEIDRPELIQKMKPIQAEIKKRLKTLRAHPKASKKGKATARDLLRQWASLWTYLEHDGVVPTNNEAERGIRKAVLWRKVSFGVESDAGAQFVERILTLVGTARRRSIDLLAWMTRAIQASLEGRTAPAFRA